MSNNQIITESFVRKLYYNDDMKLSKEFIDDLLIILNKIIKGFILTTFEIVLNSSKSNKSKSKKDSETKKTIKKCLKDAKVDDISKDQILKIFDDVTSKNNSSISESDAIKIVQKYIPIESNHITKHIISNMKNLFNAMEIDEKRKNKYDVNISRLNANFKKIASTALYIDNKILIAFIEAIAFIAEEIIDESSDFAYNNNKVIIKSKHLNDAINNYTEMKFLFEKN